jgi:hypothetical protein
VGVKLEARSWKLEGKESRDRSEAEIIFYYEMRESV